MDKQPGGVSISVKSQHPTYTKQLWAAKYREFRWELFAHMFHPFRMGIGGWGVSPNREISMAPVSVMPLGFWSSINPPRAGRRFFGLLHALSLCARVLKKRYRFCSYAQGF